jgi:phosphatidylserine decarboxylase
MDECRISDPEGYPHFNAFFYRELKPSARPIAAPQDDGVVVSPADCRLIVFPSVTEATAIWVKGARFTVETLLGPSLAEEAKLFVGGALCIARLAPQDYHRWHLPVTGRLVKRVPIDGALYTVNPIAIRRQNPDVYTENKREVWLIRTRRFGLVALIAVGATIVGSINTVIPEGSFARKGDSHGYFAFGGSTTLVLFQRGTVGWDADLAAYAKGPLETYVRVGEQVGKAVAPDTAHPGGLTDADADYAAYAASIAAAAAGGGAGGAGDAGGAGGAGAERPASAGPRPSTVAASLAAAAAAGAGAAAAAPAPLASVPESAPEAAAAAPGTA